LVVVAVCLSGCNNKPKVEPKLPPPPQIVQDAKQVLDNAKGVSETLEKQADDQRKRFEDATK